MGWAPVEELSLQRCRFPRAEFNCDGRLQREVSRLLVTYLAERTPWNNRTHASFSSYPDMRNSS